MLEVLATIGLSGIEAGAVLFMALFAVYLLSLSLRDEPDYNRPGCIRRRRNSQERDGLDFPL